MELLKSKSRILLLIGIALLFGFTHFSYLWTAWHAGRLPVMTWGFFHYELNARYFKELGYTDLYSCAHLADSDGNRLARSDIKMRNLRTYQEVLPADSEPCPRSRFSPERWQAFVQDTIELWHEPMWLYGTPFYHNPTLYWNSITFDKGYNAPPPLIVLTQWSLSVTDGLGSWQRGILTLIDIGFLAAALYAAGRVFGWQAVSALAAAVLLYWGVREMVVGSLWQQVWFASLVFMMVRVEEKRWAEAGFWLGFASMTRVFPVFFVIPFIVRRLQLTSVKQHADKPGLNRFFVALAITVLGFGVVGLFTGRGIDAWPLFFEKMALHSHFIIGEYFNVGWKNVVAITLAPYATEFTRLDLYDHWKWAIILPVLGLTTWIAVRFRRSSWDQWMVVSLVLLFLWIVVSPYYMITLALLPLLMISKRSAVVRAPRASLYILALYLLFTQACVEVSRAMYLDPLLLHALTQGGLMVYFAWLLFMIPTQAKQEDVENVM